MILDSIFFPFAFDTNGVATRLLAPSQSVSRFFLGMDGRSYSLYKHVLFRYNALGERTPVLGTSLGRTEDGKNDSATENIAVVLEDVFVDRSGKFYFRESGAIRTITDDGKIYKLIKEDGVLEERQPLHWPVPRVKCSGYTMEYSESRNSLIFPYTSNGLSGVAEYLNP